ncbi:rod shape-determining protein MreC [Candidatus Microgenomates bacterium]|nr:rod shape-determining protein MreC [Candidatus Microgenomates bacterium]
MKEKRLFLFLFLLAFLLFILDKKQILLPFKEQLGQRLNPIRASIYSLLKRPTEFFEGLREKDEEVKKAKKVGRELEVCQYESQVLEKENEDMRRLLQAPLPKNWAFLPAKILGRKRYLIIDKGTNDKVEEGMTIVFENFLVGRVIKVEPTSSLVILPTDSESKISVKTENRARGLLEGRFGTKIFLTKVLQRETLEIGDLVVTSGEEGYLSDLLIGRVKTQAQESEKPFKEVEVEAELDYSALTTVFLVRE